LRNLVPIAWLALAVLTLIDVVGGTAFAQSLDDKTGSAPEISDVALSGAIAAIAAGGAVMRARFRK